MSARFIVQLTQWIQISVLDVWQLFARAEHWHNPAEKKPKNKFQSSRGLFCWVFFSNPFSNK
jgi:hypothetical protein